MIIRGMFRSSTYALVVAMVAVVGPRPADSENGVFDRSQEIRRYIDVITADNSIDATMAARKLHYSGITDAGLSRVISDRLARTYQGLAVRDAPGAPWDARSVVRNIPSVDVNYGVSMIEALASLGVEDGADVLHQIASTTQAGGSTIKQLRKVAALESTRIGWYRERNEIMSSMQNHHDGDDPHVSMLINLLTSQNPTFREHAMDAIHREHLIDPRLFRVIYMQVEDYLLHPPPAFDHEAEQLMAHTVRTLGLSSDRSQADVLNKVLESKLPSSVKKEAKAGLVRLK